MKSFENGSRKMILINRHKAKGIWEIYSSGGQKDSQALYAQLPPLSLLSLTTNLLHTDIWTMNYGKASSN